MKLQLSSWAITRPVPVIVIFLALTIAGLFFCAIAGNSQSGD